MPKPVTIPLLNPNEPEALLASLYIKNQQPVNKGDPLGTIETTKSTAEITAEADGVILELSFQAGDTVRAGDLLCYLADNVNDKPGQTMVEIEQYDQNPGDSLPDLRISKPALALARQNRLELTQLPRDRFITEAYIQAMLNEKSAQENFDFKRTPFDPTAIIVYGGGGHGKSVIELIRTLGSYQVIGVIDDGLSPGDSILGVPVLGGSGVLEDLYKQGVRMAANAVGGIGNISIRMRVFERITRTGLVCPTLVHPSAYVEPSARLEAGIQIFPHAYVGSDARIGYGCIINTGAIVSHDCTLEDFVNISPGAILAGEVFTGKGALIGMGVTINLRVNIGAGARIGNSSTIKSDVPAKGMVRAGTVWPD